MTMSDIEFLEYIKPQIKRCIEELYNGHMEYGIQFGDYYCTRFSFYADYNANLQIARIHMDEESTFVCIDCKINNDYYDSVISIFANAILTVVKDRKILKESKNGT